jgi:hypothetical protein
MTNDERITELRAEVEQLRRRGDNQQRQIDLLGENMKDFVKLYQKLNASLVQLQNAVEAMGVRRN